MRFVLPVLTTRMFRPVRQMVAPVGRKITLFGRYRQMAAPGAKSAVFDYILALKRGY